MTADRMRRVDEAVREVLSDAIATEIKDPRVGFVTVTAVDTSPGLRHAKVFVSILGHAGVRGLLAAPGGVARERHGQRGALPEVVVVGLGDRRPEPLLEVRLQRLDLLALALQARVFR